MERNLPHLILTGPTLTCCLQCNGQGPGRGPVVHESTCRFVRKLKTWTPPDGWRVAIPHHQEHTDLTRRST